MCVRVCVCLRAGCVIWYCAHSHTKRLCVYVYVCVFACACVPMPIQFLHVFFLCVNVVLLLKMELADGSMLVQTKQIGISVSRLFPCF